MRVYIKELTDDLFEATTKMITGLMNYHRNLNNAPKEYWQTDEESKEALNEWKENGVVYNIFLDDKAVGFFYVRFGGQDVAWLEDIFIVDVVPRNTNAIKMYRECGFDHLNIIQLRKNYDKRLNKEDEVEILGNKFKKY